jgi:hypothetical protein
VSFLKTRKNERIFAILASKFRREEKKKQSGTMGKSGELGHHISDRCVHNATSLHTLFSSIGVNKSPPKLGIKVRFLLLFFPSVARSLMKILGIWIWIGRRVHPSLVLPSTSRRRPKLRCFRTAKLNQNSKNFWLSTKPQFIPTVRKNTT